LSKGDVAVSPGLERKDWLSLEIATPLGFDTPLRGYSTNGARNDTWNKKQNGHGFAHGRLGCRQRKRPRAWSAPWP